MVHRCGLIVLLAVSLMAPWSSTTALAIESISLYEVDIDISSAGTLDVTETIAYDFDSANNHGLFRFIPLKHKQPASSWYKERTIDIDDVAVLMDNRPVPFLINESAGVIEIKIGDPDQTITGAHTYKITYDVVGSLWLYDDAPPELYWNVTGNEWPVPIDEVRATVSATPGAFVGEVSCYSGVLEKYDRCEVRQTGNSFEFRSNDLRSQEGVTIAVALDSRVIDAGIHEEIIWSLIVVPIVLVLILLLVWRWYRYKTAHDPDLPVVAQYEPYPEVLPMYTGVLQDGHLHAHDITAGLLYMAQAGYITISKTSKKVLFLFNTDDYELELIKPVDGTSRFLQDVVNLLFRYGEVGRKVSLSDLQKDKYTQQANYKKLQKLRRDIKKDLIDKGFYEMPFSHSHMLRFTIFAVVAFIVLFVVSILWNTYFSPIYIPPLFEPIAALVIVILFALGVFRRRTRKGYEALNHIEGFKEYLSVTDKKRFKFHNTPSKNPQQFLEYLPYAVALGVEEEWAKVFEGVTIPSPTWYEGGSVGYFNATSLTRDLGNFSIALASSSGSSGGSASSGGGFSGGGSGGGGGGSW